MQVFRVTWSGLRAALTNLVVGMLWLGFAYSHVIAFGIHARPSLLLLGAFETLFAAFLVFRRDPSAVSTGLGDWATTLIGTFSPLLLRPTTADDLWFGQLVQVAGLLIGIAGLFSLNRSIGLLPANRGVCTGGVYRVIRHPLYSAYLVNHLGYTTTHLSNWNVTVLLVTLAAQILRIRREEALLSGDPVYSAYMARTRWRLIPLLF